MSTNLSTVGDLFNRMQSAFGEFSTGAKTGGSVSADLGASLNSAIAAVGSELGDDDAAEEKVKLLSTVEAPEEFQSLNDLSSFVGSAIDALSSLSSSVSSFSAATSSLQTLQSSISTALAPPPPPPPAPEPVIENNLFAQTGTTDTTATTTAASNNLFAEPEPTATSTAPAVEPVATTTAATETATTTVQTTTATESAAPTGPSPNGNAYGLHKDVRDQLVRFKQDKGAGLDSETNAALQAAIDELEPLVQGATGNGNQAAIESLDDLETFVGNASTAIGATVADPVLNPAGFAPPGLNKLKDHLHGKNNPTPVEPPPPPPPPPPPTTTDTGTSTGTGTGTGTGDVNINIGSGSTGGAGSTGGTGTTGGTGSTGGSGGTGGSGAPMAGTAQTIADFGQVTIDGHTTYLGSVQAPYMTTAQASQYVAGAINADQNSTVTAAVNDQGQLQLTSKTGGAISIDRVGITSTGDTSQLVDTGLQAGTFGSSVTAGSPTSPYFADTFDQVYNAISSGSMTSAPAMSSAMFAPSTATAPTATYAPTATATAAPAPAPTSTTGGTSTFTGTPVAGQTNINQPISAYSLTDFGSLNINGKQFNLGSLKTIDHTKESAAQYLANVFNVQGGGMLTAQASGSQLMLNSTTGSALTVQSLSPTLDMSNPQNRFGFAGFYAGQLGAGSLTGSSLIL